MARQLLALRIRAFYRPGRTIRRAEPLRLGSTEPAEIRDMQLGLLTERSSQRCRDSYSDHMLRRAVQPVTLREGFLRKATEICRAPGSVRNFHLHLSADRDPGRPHLRPIPNLGEPPVRPYRGS